MTQAAARQHGVRDAERGGEGVHRARHPGTRGSGTGVGRRVSLVLRVAANPRLAREERRVWVYLVMKRLCGRRLQPEAGNAGVFRTWQRTSI